MNRQAGFQEGTWDGNEGLPFLRASLHINFRLLRELNLRNVHTLRCEIHF